MKHTKKEQEQINRAWNHLHYRAQCSSQEYQLDQALNYEKRERKNYYTAKALILAQVADYYTNKPSVYQITGTSQGILLGGLAGLEAMLRTTDYTGWVPCSINELLQEIADVKTMHWARITATLEELNPHMRKPSESTLEN